MKIIAMLGLLAMFGGGEEGKRKEPPAFELLLRTQVLARGLDVTIGELADVTPVGDEALAIGRIVFAKAPVAGYARTVTRTELLQALAAGGQPVGRFVVKGATEATVQAVVTDVPAQDLTDAAHAVLQAVLAEEPGADTETELVTRVQHIQSPRGRQSMELKARVRGNKAGQDSATVDVDLLVDGEKWKTVPLQYRLTRFVPVLRVIGAVRGGTPLGPDNLMLAREKQTAAPGFYVRSFDAVTGMIARRNLQGGQLLTITDVGEPALIHRGDIVTVVLTRGRVKVTAKAIASQDAARGERLQLTNMTTHAPITGIATAPGTVEVPN